MSTTAIYIKTEEKTKVQAQKTAKELGLSLSAVMNRLLKQFIKTKVVTFTSEDEIPNARTRSIMKKAEENRKAGKGSPMFTSDEALIKKDPKHYRHFDTMKQWFEEQGI